MKQLANSFAGFFLSFILLSGWYAPALQAEEAQPANEIQKLLQLLVEENQKLRQEVQQLRGEVLDLKNAFIKGLAPEEKITPSGFDVTGSTLAKEKFDEALQSLTEKKLTIDQLQREVVNSINKVYAEQGIRGIQVSIPAQEILPTKPLTVQVVEPKLGVISIDKNRFFGEKNIRRFFEGKISNVEGLLIADRLVEQLDRANRHPDRQITAFLKPGEEPGTSDVTLNVQERKALHRVPPLHYVARADNSGTPNVGRLRLEQTFQYTNVFDRNHIATVQWLFNPSNFTNLQVVGASYQLPFGVTGHSLNFYGGYSAVATTAVFNTLEIFGEGYTTGVQLALELPDFKGIESKLFFGTEYTQISNALEFGTFTAIRSDVGQLPFYGRLSWQRRDKWGMFLGHFGLRGNKGGLVPNGDNEAFKQFREEAKATYVSGRLGIERYQKLFAGYLLNVRFDGQYSDDNLIPAEQGRVGGANSVRGYEESEISGDRSITARAEVRSPSLPPLFTRFLARKDETLQAVAFLDYGMARLDTGIEGDPSTTTIMGTGVGLRYQLFEYFLSKVDIAWALDDGPQTESGDVFVHFSMELNF